MLTVGNIRIIKLLSGKIKHLFVIGVIAAVVSTVVSLPVIMKPKYKSESVVYPSNLGPYSLESPTEQLMQLFQSRELKSLLLYKHELWKDYKLDTADAMFDFNYSQIFDEHIKFSQTKFESISIEVFDHNPKKAQEINKGILDAVNVLVKKMHDEKTAEFKDMFAFQMKQKKKNMDSAEKVLEELRTKYGILDYFIQVKEAKRNYYKALAQGKSAQSLRELDDQIKLLEEKGGIFRKADEMFRTELAEYERVKKDYEDKVRDLEQKFTYTTVVADANLPVKKAWPIRWLIVLSSVVSSIFLASVYFIVMARVKNLNNL